MSASSKKYSFKLVPSNYGKWFLSRNSVALLGHDQLTTDGAVDPGFDDFFQKEGIYDLPTYDSFELTVLTTTDCNLGCGYCFQNVALNPENPYMPHRIPKTFLSSKTINSIIDFVQRKMEEKHLEYSSLAILGGEPLLNPHGCLDLINASKDINSRYAMMVTNGVLLKPRIADALHDVGLNKIQVTLDGSQDLHDQVRVNHAGRGTFNTILKNIDYVVSNELFSVHIRVNVTKSNMNSLLELVDEVVARVKCSSKCTISFHWVGDVGIGFDNNVEDIDSIVDSLVDAKIKAVKSNFKLSIPRLLSCGTCGVKANPYSAVVSADGSLYSCWDSAGAKNMEIGNVVDGFLSNDIVNERWMRCGDEYENNKNNIIDSIKDRVDGKFLDYLKDYHTYFNT